MDVMDIKQPRSNAMKKRVEGVPMAIFQNVAAAGSEIFQPSRCEEDIVKCQIKRMFEQMSPGDRSFKRFCPVRLLGSPRKLESGWRFLHKGYAQSSLSPDACSARIAHRQPTDGRKSADID